MHRWFHLLVALAGLALAPVPAGAGLPEGSFESLGPFGARIVDLREDPIHPGRLYAATGSAGVYRSEDGGATWMPARQGLPINPQSGGNIQVDGLALDPVDGRVYAIVGSAIHTSDTAGEDWQLLADVSYQGGPRGGFTRLVIDRNNPSRICASNGPLGKGVYVSLDRGKTWAESNQGLPTTVIRGLEPAPSDPDLFYVAGGDRLYRATAVDGMWSDAGALPGGAFRSILVDPDHAEILWLATAAGAFRSDDGGSSWTRLDDPEHPLAAERFLLGDTVLLVARGGIHELDGGALSLREPFHTTTATGGVVLSGGSQVLATEMGVFRSPAPSLSDEPRFAYSSHGILNLDIAGIAPARNSDVLYVAVGVGAEAGVFRSPDNGLTWESRSLGLTNLDVRSIAVAPSNPEVVYVGTVDAGSEGGDNGKIFRTRDGGLTWTDVTEGIEAVHHDPRIIIDILVHPTNPDIVYASVQAPFGGVFRSANGGATWQKRVQGLESMPPQGDDWDDFVNYFAMLSLDMDPADPKRLYIGAGGCWGGVYISDDEGLTWVRKDGEGDPAKKMEVDETVIFDFLFGLHLELFDFDIDPSDPTHLIASGARGLHPSGNPQLGIIFESKDRGVSWHILHEKRESVSYFDNPITGVVIDPLDGSRLYVASRGGVQISEEGGAFGSWTFINEGLDARSRLTRSAIMDPDDPSRLYVGSALTGLWVRRVNPTPVRLTYWNAETVDGHVVLSWGAADAEGHAGFHVDRRTGHAPWERLTRNLLAGSDEYRFEDADPALGIINRYRLLEVDRRGTQTVVAGIEVPVPLGPGMVLGPAFPNPVREATRLRFTTGAEAPVRARVYDMRGRLVTTLLDQMLPPGTREVIWNRLDDSDRRVAPGLYVIQVDQSGQAASRKVLVLP